MVRWKYAFGSTLTSVSVHNRGPMSTGARRSVGAGHICEE
jgi:hypothetical protein